MNIEEKINYYLMEESIGKPVEKGIYTEEGEKVKGERKGKLFLMAKDEDDYLKRLSWKEYKKLNVPSNINEYNAKLFLDTLMNQLQFNKKVEYNSWIKREGKNASFEERVDFLLNKGAKYTKKGIKI